MVAMATSYAWNRFFWRNLEEDHARMLPMKFHWNPIVGSWEDYDFVNCEQLTDDGHSSILIVHHDHFVIRWTKKWWETRDNETQCCMSIIIDSMWAYEIVSWLRTTRPRIKAGTSRFEVNCIIHYTTQAPQYCM